MSQQANFMCGVPKLDCQGSIAILSSGLRNQGIRSHGTRQEAFRCRRRHLIRSGYIQVGSREFQSPHGGTILVLEKKTRYGGNLRQGKTGQDSGGGGKRLMPKRRNGGLIF